MNVIYLRCCLCDALQLDPKTHTCEDCGHTEPADDEMEAALHWIAALTKENA